jgi:phenylacetate-coenzyme A ligase PaaK-like adenylate-forming protein
MTKSELMDDFDDALTDRRVTRALCERALAATTDEPQPLFEAYFCLSSGGSSGRRGVFVKDLEAWTEFSLALNRSAMKRALAADGPPAGEGEIAMIAAGSAIHCTGVARAWTAGGPVRFCRIPVTLALPEIVERLNALQPAGLYGYPSVLARLAHEQREGRLRISPQSIRSTSENLLAQWRAAISEAFGAPIVDTYGTTEGLAGVSEPDGTFFTFNSDACILELVDAAGSPVPPGVASERILVTNLANRIQPLIRYEIGDRFVRQPDSPHHGHLRARVEGRADEVLRFGKVEIHPFVIRSVLVKTPEVSDYQVRQTARGIQVTAQAEVALETESLRRRLISSLASAGLRDPEVEVRAVPVLERHEDTGKLRRFIAA